MLLEVGLVLTNLASLATLAWTLHSNGRERRHLVNLLIAETPGEFVAMQRTTDPPKIKQVGLPDEDRPQPRRTAPLGL